MHPGGMAAPPRFSHSIARQRMAWFCSATRRLPMLAVFAGSPCTDSNRHSEVTFQRDADGKVIAVTLNQRGRSCGASVIGEAPGSRSTIAVDTVQTFRLTRGRGIAFQNCA